MAEGLSKLWSKLSLTEDEETEIIIDESDISILKNVLVGRFVSKRLVSMVKLGLALKMIWYLDFHLHLLAIRDGTFVFEFGNVVECNRVLYNQP